MNIHLEVCFNYCVKNKKKQIIIMSFKVLNNKVSHLLPSSYRALLAPHVNLMPKPAVAFTVAMEAPASPVTRVPSVCALHHSLGLSASIPLTAPVIQTRATMVEHVNTRQRHHTTSASAPKTSVVSSATFHLLQRPARSQSARSISTTSFVTSSVTTTRAVGTTATARSTSKIRGRTVRSPCSAGDTSTMGSVTHSVIMLDVSLMDLTVRTWKDSASKWLLHLQ